LRQVATLEIDIPKSCHMTVADIKRRLEIIGVKVEVTAVFNYIELPKTLVRPMRKKEDGNNKG